MTFLDSDPETIDTVAMLAKNFSDDASGDLQLALFAACAGLLKITNDIDASQARLAEVELRAETFERQYRQACADVATGVERASALAALVRPILQRCLGMKPRADHPVTVRLTDAEINALADMIELPRDFMAREALSQAAVTAGDAKTG